ncbi:MAG: TIGR03364 family FAD-dependent oxidoreductase [Planctomycetes bacterium]|nr:TIGR03364 family FAD-dependent oxidoreductase [Planctomycetota bacterium]NBY02052.1 TIGR03364 family FAD-dependent oxidoreductase [Planctomycetota bacterium]
MTKIQKIGIIGAGIVGLSHAWSAAKRGHSVTVFERSSKAYGASIRNFGMVWPIGLPHGKLYQTGLESRELWLELQKNAGIWINPCGSLHLAHEKDEWEVLQEFASLAPTLGYKCNLLNKNDIIKKSKSTNTTNLYGALWSPTELCIDSPNAINTIPLWLEQTYNVKFFFDSTITNVKHPEIQLSTGEKVPFDQIFICTGHDFKTLFPIVYQASEIKQCKLQMIKIGPQPKEWLLGPHIAGGLTIRHYKNFQACRSQIKVKERYASKSPKFDKFGIHVMASQNQSGDVITGDSHDYDHPNDPFNNEEIDNLIIQELKKLVTLPNNEIKNRWNGIYAKHQDLIQFINNPENGVTIVNSTSGLGMTMSFGLAEAYWRGDIITKNQEG